jgi:sulfate permease, SulP family
MVIDCSSIIDIESTALKMLAEAEEKLQREGVRLCLAALNPSVFTTVSRSRVGQTMGTGADVFQRANRGRAV